MPSRTKAILNRNASRHWRLPTFTLQCHSSIPHATPWWFWMAIDVPEVANSHVFLPEETHVTTGVLCRWILREWLLDVPRKFVLHPCKDQCWGLHPWKPQRRSVEYAQCVIDCQFERSWMPLSPLCLFVVFGQNHWKIMFSVVWPFEDSTLSYGLPSKQ